MSKPNLMKLYLYRFKYIVVIQDSNKIMINNNKKIIYVKMYD